MKRNEFIFIAGAVGAAALTAAARSAESDYSVSTPTGTIYGTLTLPPKMPAPVVLIVAGSGPTDRSGNSSMGIAPETYRLLAGDLAQRGVASVRYDKRGIGASASAMTQESDLRFDTYVDDAVAWLKLLAGDARFSRVAVAGHSEGSLIGMIAVRKAPAAAFVSLEGAGRPAAAVLREQLKGRASPQEYATADAIITQLQQGHMVANTPAAFASLFRSSVQPYLVSWFKYDPAVEIGKIQIPATIVQGTADVQVGMVDADALKKGDPTAALIVINGMNHVLKYAPDTSSETAIAAGYQNGSLPVDLQAVEAVYSAAVT
ncbi:MAG TPA: alpha/beta hydrolase [Candidatus Cybelea sp.]